jgi:hypothetical protein
LTITRIEEHVVPGKRLGRHVDHRLRQLARPYEAPRKAVNSVTWERRIPILDQGDVGSCTGNAMAGALGTGPLFDALNQPGFTLAEAEALRLYSEAEVIDGDGPYPPQDNGSTGPSVATAAKDDGLISGFGHYTDLDSTLQALMDGPVILGVNWYSSFDTPAADGTVSISGDAFVRGGHEVLARIVDAEAQVIGLDNSWGTSYGVGGSFKMSYATLERLLSEDGDCTAPQPLKAPAPTPQPSPTPPGPSPIPVPPTPAPDHQHLLQELARLIRNGEARLVDFLDRHNL